MFSKTVKIKNKSGFTLLEMIVATAIFTIVSTICIGIYVATIKANAKISAMQKVQNEIRYCIEYISREIRLGTIDYDYYDNSIIINPERELALLDNSKNTILFQRVYEYGNGYLKVKYGNTNSSPINGKNISIESLDFYISPVEYPPGSGDITKQELVTIVMNVFDKNQQSNLLIQTTIVSRNYKQ